MMNEAQEKRLWYAFEVLHKEKQKQKVRKAAG